MEDWSFPPAYNSSYLPDPSQRFWYPKRETMDPGAREKAILERIREVMAYAYAKAPFYKNKWDEAGIHPSHIRSLADLRAKAATLLQRGIGVRAKVEVLAPNTLERAQHKARRVIDDRNLFASLQQDRT